ncbi:uncharacterized protein PF3D7_1120600-like [Aedes albopictus]|uniref:Uncharacterized protein n=1 Tax=Aedes albopictus TaxID=7160 RepID=A0ABM1ZQH7_AEDAL
MREQSYIESSNHQEPAEKWDPVIVLQEQQNEDDERRENPEEESKTSLDNVSDRFEVDHLPRDEIFNDEENISDKMQETHVEVKPTNQTSLSFDKQQPQLRDDEENDEKTIEGVDVEENALVKMREESFMEALDHVKHAEQLDQVNILRLPENLENVEENISSQEANKNSESISCDATQEDTDFINKVLETSTENVAESIQVSDVQPSIDDVHASQPSEVELVVCEDDENIIKTINKRADDEENGGSPCDTDTVNIDRVQKTDTEENNVAPVNAPNNEPASSAIKLSTNSNDNNDAMKLPSQCSNWKDRRQKISMITHEEYHLNPISYIRMELPIVTAEIITTHDTDSQCFIHPNSGKILLDNADSQTEEVISIEPSILEEQHIATEVSVLDPNIETSMQSKSSSVLVKQSSTTEHKNYSEALLTSDSMNISKEFATTTSNCVYKTTTIIYGASSHQHVIEEHYTHPLIVEQIVRDVDTHPEQSLTTLNDVESDLTTSLGPMCGRNIESQNEINISTDEIVNDEENVLIRTRNESLLRDDVLDHFIFPEEYTKTIYLETPDEEASENSEKDKMSDEENLLIKMKFESEENDKDIVPAKDTSGHEISQYDTVSKDFSLSHQLQVITSSDHSEPEKGLTFVTPAVSVSAEKIENIPEYESNISSQADAGLGHTYNIQESVDHQTNPLIFEHPISDLQIQSTNISNNAELQLHTQSETIPLALKDVQNSITTTTIFLTSMDNSATREASELINQDDTDALLNKPIDDEEIALIKMREKSFLQDDTSTVRALNEQVEMAANAIPEFSEKSASQLQNILCQETPNNETDTVKQIEAINGNDQLLSRKEPEKSETDVVEILDTNDDDACQQSAPSAIEDEKESMLQAEKNSETHSCESVNETTDFPGMALEAETMNASGSIDVSDVQSCDDIVHTSQTLTMQVVHGAENDEKTREEEDQEENVLLEMREQSYIEPSNHQEQAEKWNPVIVLQEEQNEVEERREKPEEESKTSLDNVSDRFEVDHLPRDEIFNDEENISDKMQETHVEVKPTNQTSLSFDKQQPQLRDDEENDEKTIEGVDEEENALVQMRDESFLEALDLLKHGEHGDQGSILHLPENLENVEENIFSQEANRSSEPISSDATQEDTDFINKLETSTENMAGGIQVSDVQHCIDNVHTSQSSEVELVICEDEEENVLVKMREESFMEALEHAEQLDQVNIPRLPENLENVEENISSQEANRNSESFSCDATQEDTDNINKTLETSSENVAGSIQVSDVQPCIDNVCISQSSEVELAISEDEEENALVKMREESFMDALDHPKHAEQSDQVNILHLPENLENVEENIFSQEANRMSESISCDATQEGTDFINKTLETSTGNVAGSIQVSDVQHCIDNVHTSQPSEAELVISEEDENIIKTINKREDDEENSSIIIRDEFIMATADYPELAEKLDQAVVPQEDLSAEKQQTSDTSEKFEWDKASLDNVSDHIDADDIVSNEEIALLKMQETSVELKTTTHASQSLDTEEQNVCDEVTNEEKSSGREDEEENALIKMRDQSFMAASDHLEHAENLDLVNINVEENISSQEANRTNESISCEATQKDPDFINKTLDTSTENEAGNIQVSDVQPCIDSVHTSQSSELEFVICTDDENIKTLKEREDDEENASIIMREKSTMEISDYPKLAENMHPVTILQEDLSKDKQPIDRSEKLEGNKASLDNVSDCIGAEYSFVMMQITTKKLKKVRMKKKKH